MMKISINKVTNKFAYLMSFEGYGFYFIIKRCGQFLNKIKMAERNRDLSYFRENLGRGRARVLVEALEGARRRREEGPGSSSYQSPTGRVGIVPWGLTSRSLSPQSTRVVRGRGFPLNSPHHSGGAGRGRALPPPSPPPLEDIPTV